MRQQGLEPVWKRYVEATGELSRIGYRAEVEAAMNTDEMSGISLLQLQDFPGQGTALVGMMDSHLKPKPFAFARPEAFQAFFRDRLVLASLPRYTYQAGESFTGEFFLANYGKTELSAPLEYTLTGPGVSLAGSLPARPCPAGKRTPLGAVTFQLPALVEPRCPASVYETRSFDEKARQVLAQGGKVFLAPPADKEHMPQSIGTQFTTDFWSVGTFPAQEGSMGQLIDTQHPIFQSFPTEYHTNWQWWPMASQRAFVLPHTIQAIVTEMDCYAYLRPMAQLFEARCGGGVILASSMGLQDLQQYPEARALLHSLYQYMDSESFAPQQELPPELFASLAP